MSPAWTRHFTRRPCQITCLLWIIPSTHRQCRITCLWITLSTHHLCRIMCLLWITPSTRRRCQITCLLWIIPSSHHRCQTISPRRVRQHPYGAINRRIQKGETSSLQPTVTESVCSATVGLKRAFNFFQMQRLGLRRETSFVPPHRYLKMPPLPFLQD